MQWQWIWKETHYLPTLIWMYYDVLRRMEYGLHMCTLCHKVFKWSVNQRDSTVWAISGWELACRITQELSGNFTTRSSCLPQLVLVPLFWPISCFFRDSSLLSVYKFGPLCCYQSLLTVVKTTLQFTYWVYPQVYPHYETVRKIGLKNGLFPEVRLLKRKSLT